MKTAAQTVRYGGVTGEAYDRCYHQACDTHSNKSTPGLRSLAKGAAHATAVYAAAKEQFPAAAAAATSATAKAKAGKKSSARTTRFRGHELAR